jgi:hypothetical protein
MKEWDDIETETKSIIDWLEENSDDKLEPNVYNWEVIKHPKYHIPQWRRNEFLSEYKKAILRNEELKICEIGGENYKFHIDLDVKCKINEDDIENEKYDISKFFNDNFLKEILNFFQKFGKENNIDTSFSLSGCKGKVKSIEFNYKFGYHLIFNNFVVTKTLHKDILKKLIDEFKDLKLDSSIQNDIYDIFDITRFESEITLRYNIILSRLIYSIKSISCKSCMKLSNSKKSKNKIKLKNKICDECNNTGMRDKRKYDFITYYDLKNDKFINKLELSKIIEYSSIILF